MKYLIIYLHRRDADFIAKEKENYLGNIAKFWVGYYHDTTLTNYKLQTTRTNEGKLNNISRSDINEELKFQASINSHFSHLDLKKLGAHSLRTGGCTGATFLSNT